MSVRSSWFIVLFRSSIPCLPSVELSYPLIKVGCWNLQLFLFLSNYFFFELSEFFLQWLLQGLPYKHFNFSFRFILNLIPVIYRNITSIYLYSIFPLLVVVLLYLLHLLMLQIQQYIITITLTSVVTSLAQYNFVLICLLWAVIGKYIILLYVMGPIHLIYILFLTVLLKIS